MAARRAKQLYFTKNDDELWEAITSIPDGEQNHEIRRALRYWFLGKGERTAPGVAEKPAKEAEKVTDVLKLPDRLMKF